MTHDPTVTVLPRGVSGYQEGAPPFQPKLRGPTTAKVKRTAHAGPSSGWTPERAAKFKATMARKRAKKGGAPTKAETGSSAKHVRIDTRPVVIAGASDNLARYGDGGAPAPGSLAAKPDRANRLRACIEELTIERDSLTVIIEHLERLVS